MTEQDFCDFLSALGDEFCTSLANVPGVADIVPHDAYEVFQRAFCQKPDPQFLASLSELQLEQWRTAFEAYFECRGISTDQIRNAVQRTLVRWPYDPEEVIRMAQSLIERYCDKHTAEHHAMDRQNKQLLTTPAKYFWAAVAQRIRKSH